MPKQGPTRRSRSRSRNNRLQQLEKEGSQLSMTPGTPIVSPYKPLDNQSVVQIHQAALQLLEDTGMGNATPEVLEIAQSNGCRVASNGRLLFPRAVIERTLKVAAKNFVLHGRDPAYDFEARNGRINFCTGGAAVTMLDIKSQNYRPSTLNDLYDLSRLSDTLQNIQWFTRPIVLTDIDDPFELDVNTIYACAAGTQKHIATSIVKGEHVSRLLPR